METINIAAEVDLRNVENDVVRRNNYAQWFLAPFPKRIWRLTNHLQHQR